MKRKISAQMKRSARRNVKEKALYDGADDLMPISTGSTLLDLAITGNRFVAGGIPMGILVEIFGPHSCGKTVLMCELAGAIQRKGGNVLFYDPEARLNKQFARMFGLNAGKIEYVVPETITEVFSQIRKWNPPPAEYNGIFADSLAALSTDMEMDSDEGDKMGMRRAKEFSQELRKTCRIITKKNYLVVCSNQIRVNPNAGKYEVKTKSTGGEAIGFYASLRLRGSAPQKIKEEKTLYGKKITRAKGVQTKFDVFKSSIWESYREAPLTVLSRYGIDDIRQNLQFIKDYTKNKTYTVGGENAGASMTNAISFVGEHRLERQLKKETIALWHKIETLFDDGRKPKYQLEEE